MNYSKLFYAILFIVLFSGTSVLADVKIKSKQTMSGQTYETTTYIKGKRQRTEQNFGGLLRIELTQCDLKRDIQINPSTMTYMIDSMVEGAERVNVSGDVPSNNGMKIVGGTVTSTVSSKNTGETKRMFGYTAYRVLTTIETESSPDACADARSKMQIDGWYIDAAFQLDCDSQRSYGKYQRPEAAGGCKDKYKFVTIGNAKRGFAVYEKMTMLDTNGKESFSSIKEVVELSQANLEQSFFEVPSDYREVSDSSQLYSAAALSAGSFADTNGSSAILTANPSYSNQSGSTKPENSGESSVLGPKAANTVRVGITVKTGAVGDGLNSAKLGEAVRNTLADYLKGTEIEVVFLDAKLSKAIENEARQKECDYVLYAFVSHKKGGGGGLFGKVLAPAIGRTGIGHTGSTAGNVAGQVATQAIVSAGTVSEDVKSKDEITLEIKLQTALTGTTEGTQFKAKAKSDGEDIISNVVEKAADYLVAKTGS